MFKLLEINNVHVHHHKVATFKGISMAVPDDGNTTSHDLFPRSFDL